MILAGIPSSGVSLGLESLAASFASAPFTLVATSVLTLLATLVFLRLISNTFTGRKPPVSEGIPLIGGLLKFSRGPWELMQEIYAKHGEVVTVPLLHKKMTFLFGPSGTLLSRGCCAGRAW
jgi:sterol 14-demethylase